MKRVCAVLLGLSLLTGSALAAGSAAEQATQLHELGLFYGIDSNTFDAESMALDRPATRVEGVTMLLRVLGMEEQAQSNTVPAPFSDVPDWAGGYLGCAYETGLALGKGDGTFGSADPLTLDQFTTMLLRAVGYSSESDFAWDAAADYAQSVGMYEDGLFSGADAGAQITRGDMVQASWAALHHPMPGTGATLYDNVAPADAEPDSVSKGVSEEMLAMVNEARAEEGLSPLTLNETVCQAAQVRALEISDTFSHDRPDGSRCFTVLDELGIPQYRAVGENIAKGQSSVRTVMDAWLGSTGHRANILSEKFTQLGVGYDEESNSWVQLFYTPLH